VCFYAVVFVQNKRQGTTRIDPLGDNIICSNSMLSTSDSLWKCSTS